jgi:hypothetical protein
MVQTLIIVLLFIAALVYLGLLIYRSFTSAGCSSGCGSCGIDFSKIEKQLGQNVGKK